MRTLVMCLVLVGAAAAQEPVGVIKAFSRSQAGIHTRSPATKLRVLRDAEHRGDSILVVNYAAPTADPSARDVWLDGDLHDWTTGAAVVFQVKPAHSSRLSVSFMDRNHVVYTAWTDLPDTTWQTVRVAFDAIRPNPYFQPPDAKHGAPIDVSSVPGLGFSPQDKTSGTFAVRKVVLSP